jgi:hypothetical protein
LKRSWQLKYAKGDGHPAIIIKHHQPAPYDNELVKPTTRTKQTVAWSQIARYTTQCFSPQRMKGYNNPEHHGRVVGQNVPKARAILLGHLI